MTAAVTTWQASGTWPQRGEYRWIVKEAADGKPWIVGEPGAPLRIIGPDGEHLHFGFFLRPDLTRDDANRVARFLNEWITHVALF